MFLFSFLLLLYFIFTFRIEKEFEEVKNISMQWNASFEVAQMPEHREKNRYSNILPCNYIYIYIYVYTHHP